MRAWLGLALLVFTSVALASDQCAYKPPTFEALPYKEGDYLPVYFSKFQLSLPSKPVAFLSTNGFIAVYPDKKNVGMSHIGTREMEGTLERLVPELTKVSEYYRLIYGAPTSIRSWDSQELKLQRTLAELDCTSKVKFFRINDVEVIFHRAEDKGGFHRIIVMDGDSVELITVFGADDMALQIVSSIKRRL